MQPPECVFGGEDSLLEGGREGGQREVNESEALPDARLHPPEIHALVVGQLEVRLLLLSPHHRHVRVLRLALDRVVRPPSRLEGLRVLAENTLNHE